MNNIKVRHDYFKTFNELKKKTNELTSLFHSTKIENYGSTEPVSPNDLDNLYNLITQIREEIRKYKKITTAGEYNFFNILEEEATDIKGINIAIKILDAIKSDTLQIEILFAKIATPGNLPSIITTFDIFNLPKVKLPTYGDYKDTILYFGAECLDELAIIKNRIYNERLQFEKNLVIARKDKENKNE